MVTVNRKTKIMGSDYFDYEFKGLSTDTKPTTNVATNSIFWELDTDQFYFYNGSSWVEIGE